MQEKKCPQCKTVKPVDAFSKNRQMKDGLATHCKVCKSLFDRKYRERYPERVKAKAKIRRDANKDKMRQYREDNKERIAVQSNKWHCENYAKNRDKVLEKVKIYYRENKEVVTAYAKRYREENPDKLKQVQKKHYWANREERIAAVKAYQQTPAGKAMAARARSKRRTREERATPAWSNRLRETAIYELRDSLIEDCHGEPFHVDHDIPLQGKKVSGLHVHNNLEVMQGTHNCVKRHNFDVDELPLGIPGDIWLAYPNAVYSTLANKALNALHPRLVVRRAA